MTWLLTAPAAFSPKGRNDRDHENDPIITRCRLQNGRCLSKWAVVVKYRSCNKSLYLITKCYSTRLPLKLIKYLVSLEMMLFLESIKVSPLSMGSLLDLAFCFAVKKGCNGKYLGVTSKISMDLLVICYAISKAVCCGVKAGSVYKLWKITR